MSKRTLIVIAFTAASDSPTKSTKTPKRESDTVVVGFTSPVPLVSFRTPPISLSNTLSAE